MAETENDPELEKDEPEGAGAAVTLVRAGRRLRVSQSQPASR